MLESGIHIAEDFKELLEAKIRKAEDEMKAKKRAELDIDNFIEFNRMNKVRIDRNKQELERYKQEMILLQKQALAEEQAKEASKDK